MDKAKHNTMRLKRRLGYILVPLIYGLVIGGLIFGVYIASSKIVDKYIVSYSASEQAEQSDTVESDYNINAEETTWQ